MLGPSIEELREISANEAEKRANEPRVLTSTRFMEVRSDDDLSWILVNVHQIKYVVPDDETHTTIRLVGDNEDTTDLIHVNHSYAEIKNALKQFFR